MKTKLLTILFVMVLMMPVMALTPTSNQARANNNTVADGESSPIYITQNSDFVIYADSGMGTAENPYLISYKVLTDFGDACIYIMDTDAYAVFDNVFLDGIGWYGIYLENVQNINVTNSVITQKAFGISIQSCARVFLDTVSISDRADGTQGVAIEDSDNISVRDCTINSARMGVSILDCYRVEIVGNTFVGSGLSFYGTSDICTGIRIEGNTVNGKPLGYLYNKNDRQYDISVYGQAILVGCTNITLYNGNIQDTSIGVQFVFSQNCVIAYSNLTSNAFGVTVYESSYCRIQSCNFTENTIGLSGNFAVGTIVRENNFINNIEYGIFVMTGVSSSILYLNNFIGNGIGNARDDGSIQDSNLIWLAVKFTNSKSGQPLSNVSVTIERGARSYTGYSNEDGLFKVPLPVLGEYNFTISKFRYQTKTYINYAITTTGIHYYEISLEKENLGSGTGYVLARLMDGTTPIVGATVRTYSYLDGAYYFHSEEISAVSPAGWVNITGLYYDDYYFVITHPDYEQRVIRLVIVGDGYIATYNNVQLTELSSTAFVYGWVVDDVVSVGLANTTILLYNENQLYRTVLTDIAGFFNITQIQHGTYRAVVTKDGYTTEYRQFTVDSDGNQPFNPAIIAIVPEDYAPEEALASIVNDWDNGALGNFWDDRGGVIALAEESSVYEIEGTNIGNPVDEYPLDAIYSGGFGWVLPSDSSGTPTTTSTTNTIDPTPTENYITKILLLSGSVILGCVALVIIMRTRKR